MSVIKCDKIVFISQKHTKTGRKKKKTAYGDIRCTRKAKKKKDYVHLRMDA